MLSQLRAALVAFAAITLLTGLAYPLTITLVAQAMFPDQANGSLIRKGSGVVGSGLIGQPFDDPKYVWGRPSATSPAPYNASASGGSNLGPTNPELIAAIRKRIETLRADAPEGVPIPVDLVTASASGLDPHISPASAEFQARRVAVARGIPEDLVRSMIRAHTEPRTFGVLGEPRVNVLRLNLALDAQVATHPKSS